MIGGGSTGGVGRGGVGVIDGGWVSVEGREEDGGGGGGGEGWRDIGGERSEAGR